MSESRLRLFVWARARDTFPTGQITFINIEKIRFLSLLELSHGELMSMLPGMKEILNPVVDGVMQPVVNVVANQLGPDLNEPLCEDMVHGINESFRGR